MKPTALYSLSPNGKAPAAPFTPPDVGLLGKEHYDTLPIEVCSFVRGVYAKFGADVAVSLALDNHAQSYGYMPVNEAKATASAIILPEIVMRELANDSKLAQGLVTEYALHKGVDAQVVQDERAKQRAKLAGAGVVLGFITAS